MQAGLQRYFMSKSWSISVQIPWLCGDWPLVHGVKEPNMGQIFQMEVHGQKQGRSYPLQNREIDIQG